MKSNVVYQAYGRQDILEQNLFSLVSLLRKHPGLPQVEKILVYTDRPEYFRDYLGAHSAVEYLDLTPEKVQKWRGAINFVHRVKIEMLKDAAARAPQSKVFYLDGDTHFLKDPGPLLAMVSDSESVMHESENVIEQGKDPLSKKISKFLKKNEFLIQNKKLRVPPSNTMWNAGVLGFTPAFFPSLQDVLEFTDQAYGRYPKHVMEQLAFSYFLDQHTKIRDAREYVHHYWRQKDEYSALIRDFFERNKNVQEGLTNYDAIVWPAPPEPKKSGWQKLIERFRI